MRRIFSFLFSGYFIFQFISPVFSQDVGLEMLQKNILEMQKNMQMLQQTIASQNEMLQKQQLQIHALESKVSQTVSVPSAIIHEDLSHAHERPAHAGSLEMGAIGDIVGQIDSPNNEDREGRDRVSARELELMLGGAINADSRLDATVSFSDFEEVNLEEAYLMHEGLPWGLTGRFGKFKPKIGKALKLHRYALETIDEPLVIQRYFGAEGYSKAGADLTKNLNLPGPFTPQMSMGLLEGGNGEEGTLFADSRRHPTFYASLKNDFNFTEKTSFEAGLSYLGGSSDTDLTFGTHVFGADLTYIWRYADQQHFKILAETFTGTRDENIGEEAIDAETGAAFFPEVDDSRDFWGSYILADWRFHSRWATGVRFDHASLVKTLELADADGSDVGWATYLTFYQNEFARWRIQLNQRNLTAGKDPEYEAFLQGTFTIGQQHQD